MTPEPERDAQHERDRRWASWALSCWRDFPADAIPRPLVIGSSVRVERGFRTRDARIAFRRGELIGTDEVPDAVLEVVRQAGTADAPGVKVAPLEITGATREVSELATDRGRRSFDAWRLSSPALLGDLVVLDPAVASTRWAPPSETRPPRPYDGARHLEFRAAVVGTSDFELVVSFAGGPPAQFDYPDAELLESPTAFTVIPHARPTAAYEPDMAVAAVGVFRQVQVRLGVALAGRVLVDLDGSACVVDREDA